MSGPRLIGSAAADHDLKIRRGEIKLRNDLAHAVRTVHATYDHPELPVEWCPNCNGYGSSLKEAGDRCSKCGGSGLKS